MSKNELKKDAFTLDCEKAMNLYSARCDAYGDRPVFSLENGNELSCYKTASKYLIIRYKEIGGQDYGFEGIVPDSGYARIMNHFDENGSQLTGFYSKGGEFHAVESNYGFAQDCFNYLQGLYELNSTVEEDKSL